MPPVSLSRRLMLGNVAAGLAFAPCLARADTGSHLAPPSVLPPPLPSAVEHIQGAADDQNRLTVETMVNGQGPFRFVVDTGADRSVICDDLAKSLGLPADEDMIVEGIARSMPAPSARLDRLQIGRVVMTDLVLPTLPRSWLGGDGYLGLDVIDRQAVTFDFQNHRLAIAPSDRITDWVPVADGAVVRVDGSHGRLTAVNCSVDGVKAYAFVDSGAEISIGNSALFDALAKEGGKYLNDSIVQLLGVTGGAAQGRIMGIESIKLGSIRFVHSALVISDLPIFELWGLENKPALFIGMNFLRQVSSVTIDYGRKELRFRLAEAARIARNA
ncbi:MAG: aspartyl protease family protein [Alphaproteobacteria bacterium]|nr:aspartyl protease family protein [Alphaproteobacteria bacterium]MBL7096174.1 aspartyl protease family protein [Alphaproteobacteria bacterium]